MKPSIIADSEHHNSQDNMYLQGQAPFKAVKALLKEAVVFFKEGVSNFHHTGTLCATSKWAAKTLANPLRKKRAPMKILEVGAGTGSVTVEILKDMIAGDYLTICEINPRFMEAVQERLSEDPIYALHKDKIKFFVGPVQDLPEEDIYDVVVSSLPFLNFTIQTVEEIFDKLSKVSTDKTIMTYYEYIGLRKVGKVVSSPDRRKRIIELDRYFKEKHAASRIGHERVWLNVLPINVYTLKLTQAVA